MYGGGGDLHSAPGFLKLFQDEAKEAVFGAAARFVIPDRAHGKLDPIIGAHLQPFASGQAAGLRSVRFDYPLTCEGQKVPFITIQPKGGHHVH